jgi:hypothetical protein
MLQMSVNLFSKARTTRFFSSKFVYNGALLFVGVAIVAVFTFARL